MNRLVFSLLAMCATLFVSCSRERTEDPTAAADWRPEEASVARHITSVHGFVVGTSPESHLRVGRDETGSQIVGEFRPDVLETLGGEKALFVMGWSGNPQLSSRHEYLFFLDALHAYLVLHHPQWDGGEGKATAARTSDAVEALAEVR